jgi:hypothetical protein
MAGKCEHGLTTKECFVCASPKHGAAMTPTTPPALLPLPEPAVPAFHYMGKQQQPALYTEAQMQQYALAHIERERTRYVEAVGLLHWMPRVQGRWDETDVAHAEGFVEGKKAALAAIREG